MFISSGGCTLIRWNQNRFLSVQAGGNGDDRNPAQRSRSSAGQMANLSSGSPETLALRLPIVNPSHICASPITHSVAPLQVNSGWSRQEAGISHRRVWSSETHTVSREEGVQCIAKTAVKSCDQVVTISSIPWTITRSNVLDERLVYMTTWIPFTQITLI